MNDTTFRKVEQLKRTSAYINFSIELMGDELPNKIRFHMAQYKIGFQLAQLMDFTNEQVLDDLIELGNRITNK